MDNYMQASQQLAKVMYEQTGAQAGAGAGPQPGPQPQPESGEQKKGGDDTIIDADYEVK